MNVFLSQNEWWFNNFYNLLETRCLSKVEKFTTYQLLGEELEYFVDGFRSWRLPIWHSEENEDGETVCIVYADKEGNTALLDEENNYTLDLPAKKEKITVAIESAAWPFPTPKEES